MTTLARRTVTGFEGSGEFSFALKYNSTAPTEGLAALVDSSIECKQFVRWDCKQAGEYMSSIFYIYLYEKYWTESYLRVSIGPRRILVLRRKDPKNVNSTQHRLTKLTLIDKYFFDMNTRAVA